MNKPYTLASERAAAPTGCAYVAPTFWNKWFRWDGSRTSGHYQLGGQDNQQYKRQSYGKVDCSVYRQEERKDA